MGAFIVYLICIFGGILLLKKGSWLTVRPYVLGLLVANALLYLIFGAIVAHAETMSCFEDGGTDCTHIAWVVALAAPICFSAVAVPMALFMHGWRTLLGVSHQAVFRATHPQHTTRALVAIERKPYVEEASHHRAKPYNGLN